LGILRVFGYCSLCGKEKVTRGYPGNEDTQIGLSFSNNFQ
jgi:hypothetical protein